MVLVFIILGIVIFTLFIFAILLLSTIKIEIKNLKVVNGDVVNLTLRINKEDESIFSNSKIKYKYEIKISLKFLEIIPILWLKVDKKKIDKIRNSKKIKNIDINKIRNKIKEKEPSKKEVLQAVRKIKIKLEKLNFIAYLGTEDSIITSYITALIASIIGILLPHLAGKNIENCKYEITPIYQNKNEYYISLDGIFCIKIVHIISSMLFLIRKGRDEKDERTSNRRAYAYRYE